MTLQPTLGRAWWSLAPQTVRFAGGHRGLRAGLARGDLSTKICHLDFAGQGKEDARDYAGAFDLLRRAMRCAGRRWSMIEEMSAMARSRATRMRIFRRAKVGQSAPDPIFISDCRAQIDAAGTILATHSQVRRTMELPDIIGISRRLSGARRSQVELSGCWPGRPRLHALGAEYLDRTRIQRKEGKPFFIDKMPNNFAHAGLIQLILPNAKIVDARRHPLGCCFSAFKQHFARGQAFSYDLGELGRYYADYVELMRHFDAVLPGRVHRVLYEEMIDDPEKQVRRLLAACGLTFEAKCLQFYQNDRAVRTASSEQVRQPIFRDGLDQWQHFEAWLALEAALMVLQGYTR